MSDMVIRVISTYAPEERAELPEKLQRMRMEKKKARENWQRFRASSLKTIYNQLALKLKKEVADYRESPETWCKRHRQRLPPTPASKYPHIVVENPSDWAKDEITTTYFGRIISTDEIRFNPISEEEYNDVIAHLEHMKEMEPDFDYYVSQSKPSTAADASITVTAKYPQIVVIVFPNWVKHLKNIKVQFGRQAICEAYYDGIRFSPRDGPEYHFVVKYLKRIEATEPDLEYFVCPLKVGIRGLPGGATPDFIKESCAKEGYEVDHVRQIGRWYFVKLFRGEDNTSILEMKTLYGFKVKVELWRGKPASEDTRKPRSEKSNAAAEEKPATAEERPATVDERPATADRTTATAPEDSVDSDESLINLIDKGVENLVLLLGLPWLRK